MYIECSLNLRPPLFFVLWFTFSITHGSGRAFFCSSASMCYTERKPKKKKRGRPQIEATLNVRTLAIMSIWFSESCCSIVFLADMVRMKGY